MKSFSCGVLPLLAFTTLSSTLAQAQTATLEPTYGKPQIKILKSTEDPQNRYQKWEEKTLVTLGNVPASPNAKTYTTREIKIPTFNLQIQSDQTEADFSRRWDTLKAELGTITTATPELKRWELSHALSKSETTIPAQTLVPTPKKGYVSYVWITRTIEMEGVHLDEDTAYRATMLIKVDGPTTKPLKTNQTLDPDTRKIIASR